MKNLDQNSVPELIEFLLMRFPDSFVDANAQRERINASSAAFNPETDPVASSVFETVRLLRLRTEQLRVAVDGATVMGVNGDVSESPTTEIAASTPTRQIPVADRDVPAGDHATVPPPAVPSAADQAAESAPVAAESAPVAAPESPLESTQPAKVPAKWTDRERLLYRDIIHLFELGDHAGAMASLERLFMLAPDAEELGVFLGKNETTLLRLYRDHLGSMDRVTLPARGRKPVRIPTPDADLMLKIIRMSDGHRQLREFVKKLGSPELHILIVISHLIRSGYLELA